jgi:thioredoxin reductase (NADPH)
VIIASGVEYRRMPSPTVAEWEGRGVYYGAAVSEAPAMRDRQVCVAGGGNSAGQAAVHLAKFARDVTVLVRGQSLAASMSEYLITTVDAAPNIDVRCGVEVVDASGTDWLDHVVLRHRDSDTIERLSTDALFVLVGSRPQTEWLGDALVRDDWGFISTGPDLPPRHFALDRHPYPNETSIPGVFAVGDVRQGSVKRVASGVGEGAIAIPYVHRYLDDLRRAANPLPG